MFENFHFEYNPAQFSFKFSRKVEFNFFDFHRNLLAMDLEMYYSATTGRLESANLAQVRSIVIRAPSIKVQPNRFTRHGDLMAFAYKDESAIVLKDMTNQFIYVHRPKNSSFNVGQYFLQIHKMSSDQEYKITYSIDKITRNMETGDPISTNRYLNQILASKDEENQRWDFQFFNRVIEVKETKNAFEQITQDNRFDKQEFSTNSLTVAAEAHDDVLGLIDLKKTPDLDGK